MSGRTIPLVLLVVGCGSSGVNGFCERQQTVADECGYETSDDCEERAASCTDEELDGLLAHGDCLAEAGVPTCITGGTEVDWDADDVNACASQHLPSLTPECLGALNATGTTR